jgi:hypothetical protein
MSYRRIFALAICLGAALAITGESTYAQRVSNKSYRKPLPRPVSPARGRMAPAAFAAEELPAVGEQSRLAPSQPMPPGAMSAGDMAPYPFSDDSGPMPDYGSSGECCDDGYCEAPYDSGCCTTCEPYCSPSQWFFTADYLYLRSSFSDSTQFVEVDSQQATVEQTVTQFEFDYESSFRFGGGYRLSGCGDEIRFLYTRMESNSFGQQDAGNEVIVPYLIDAPLGGEYRFHGDVEINSYELEYAKTISLGGSSGCGCGCGDCCGGGGCCSSCAAWDLRWSGGFRAADAEWQRVYAALGTSDEFLEGAVSSMEFDGAGLKVGLEGRRYFFKGGWLSFYAKGDLSLLYGDLEFNTVATTEGGTAPDAIVRVSTTTNQIIPVTDLEAGVTSQVSCNGRVSAGYLLSAWHDLGFRDEIPLPSDFPVTYDDANILGFDGFFARLEYAF